MKLKGELNLPDVIREHIVAVLNHHNFNITHTYKALGIARSTLYRYVKKHNIELIRPTDEKIHHDELVPYDEGI